MVAAHIAFGQRGEELAAALVSPPGVRGARQELACPIGEIDLVCGTVAPLVVAEVKTSKSDAFGVPALAVTPTSSNASGGSPRRGWRIIGSAAGSTSASTSWRSPATSSTSTSTPSDRLGARESAGERPDEQRDRHEQARDDERVVERPGRNRRYGL